MKIAPVAATALLALAFGAANAQMKPGMKSGGMGQKGGSMGQKGGAKSMSGIVKGSPMGMKFMMGTRMGTYTVDASKANIMGMGKKMMVSDLKGGTMVTVMGKPMGKMMVMADSVNITHMPGMKKGAMKKGGAPMMKKG